MTPAERARIEQLARLLAAFLQYDWNGLFAHSTAAKGFPLWGRHWQGGRDDLRVIAAFMLGQMDDPAERAAYRRGLEDVAKVARAALKGGQP